MAYTGHGHHIPGTIKGEGVVNADKSVKRCGGPKICPRCKQDVEEYKEFGTVTDKKNRPNDNDL